MDNQNDVQFVTDCINSLEAILDYVENASGEKAEAFTSDVTNLKQEIQSLKDEITQ